MIIAAYLMWLIMLGVVFIVTCRSSGPSYTFGRYPLILLPLNALLIIYLAFSCTHDAIRYFPAPSTQYRHSFRDVPSSDIYPQLGARGKRILASLDNIDFFLHRTRLGSALLLAVSTIWLVLLCVPALIALAVVLNRRMFVFWIPVLVIAAPFISLLFWVGKRWITAARTVVRGPQQAVVGIQQNQSVVLEAEEEAPPAYEESSR